MTPTRSSGADAMSAPRLVYLAGPEVFLPDARAAGARKQALCEAHGFRGLFPLDADLTAVAPPDLSRGIYAANLALIATADCGIFNLTPFRGPSADAGTVFELGLFIGLSKPVFAYSNVAEDFFTRVTAGVSCTRAGDVWCDGLGMSVENFGNADNLMIDEALRLQGRTFHRRATDDRARFTDLVGFEACLIEAQRSA